MPAPIEVRVIVIGAVVAVLGAVTALVSDSIDTIVWPIAVGGLLVMLAGIVMVVLRKPSGSGDGDPTDSSRRG